MHTFDITAVFSACVSALTNFILWAKTTYIYLGAIRSAFILLLSGLLLFRPSLLLFCLGTMKMNRKRVCFDV